MSGRPILVLMIVSIISAIVTAYIFGLVQFGDCYPEEPRFSRCEAGKVKAGRIVLATAAILYSSILWRLVHRRKET